MLAKAVDSGIDWAEFLPLALFAIRQVPNRDLGYSPHYLVYGRDVHGPLDVLYKGWVDREFDSINVEEWLVKLNDRLSVIHDLAVNEESKNVEKRVLSFKGKSDRSLEVGSKVLMRVPGIHAALQAAWEGPYNVVDKTSRVTYKVSRGNDHPAKLAHINNLKVYVDRPLSVNAVTLVAEEQGIDGDLLSSKAILGEEKCPGFNASQLKDVLDNSAAYFSDSPGLCVSSKCEIVLVDGASPVNLPPRQIPGGIRDAVKAEIDKMLKEGIIVESNAGWASPLVPVRKKDNSVRLCVDYRELNSLTPLQRYWLPSLTEILDSIGPCMCLSTLDLSSGFHQLEMEESSSDLTTFVCPFGKFRFKRMPFGLKYAPAIFQAAVEEVLKSVGNICKNYVDDVVVYSGSWSDHLKHLQEVITCLGSAGLTIKAKKCVFGRKHLIYLGHKIGGGTLAVPELRVKCQSEFSRPNTKKQLRSFLGSFSYYRKFIPGFAKFSSALTPATSLRAPLRVVWTDVMVQAGCDGPSIL